MKLLDVRATNFGVFQQRRFEFGGDGFVVVHGPNEAGKSTLLQLLREMLFGFPHSSSYATDGGVMTAEAEAVLQDGRQLTFRRRKGRGITVEGVVDPGAIPVDDAKLAQLLGHASESLYRNVFAFSLTELADGAQSFKQAGLTLTEALFGGALGGLASLPRVKTALRREHEDLFLPRAQKPPINRLAKQIQAEKAKLKQASIRPARYEELEKLLDDIQRDISARDDRRRGHSQELAHLQRLEKAWQPWCERRAAEQELAALQLPAALRPGDVERFDELLKGAAQLAAELQQIDANIARLQRERAAIRCSPSYLECRPAIKALEQDLGKIEGYVRDLPLRRAELAKAEASISFVLRNIDPAWTIEKLQSLRLSLDERTRVRSLAEAFQALALQRQSDERDIATLQTSIARQREQLAAIADEGDVAALSAALAGQAEYLTAKKELRRDEQRAAQLARECSLLEQRLLKLVPIEDGALADLEPPLAATMEEQRATLTAIENDLAAAKHRAAQATTALRETEDRLLGLEATGAIPDRSVLEAARQMRDEGWRLIRRHYIEGTDCEKRIIQWLADPLGSLPEQYRQAVQHADQLADERLLQADAVAQKEEALRQRQAQTQRLEQAQAEVAESEQRLSVAQAAWRALWPANIAPASPAAMLEWCRLLEAWRQQTSELAALNVSQERLRQSCDGFETVLRQACADATSSIDHLLRLAAERVAAAREQHGERKARAAKLQESEQDLADRERALGALSHAEQAWQADWERLLDQLGLPRDWQVAAITQLLSAVEQILSDESAAATCRGRIRDMQAEFDAFDRAAAAMASELDPDLVPLPAIERVRALAQHCDAAAAAQLQSQSLQAELERQEAERQLRDERLAHALEERAELLARLELEDEDAFRTVAADVARRSALQDEIRVADRGLRIAREQEDEASFAAALATFDRDALERRSAELGANIHDLTTQIDALRESKGKHLQELDLMQQEGEALAVQQTLESCRSQLREQVERWASLVLAERMLDRAVEQFQRQHQENVLAEAKRLFRRLTHGEHTDIRHSVGETFLVVDRAGRERSPDQLSRGTREQLYLAFRLAYVRNYCRDREPLPLVMDDVLVNFDETRASDTLEALLELAQEVQIIFLTCHAKTVEMVRQHAPLCTLIEMGAEAVAMP